MSDDGESSDDKGFLARWSQRKREANQPDRDAPPAAADVPIGPAAEAEPEFDLSSLPKLEDMTATTDITGFLRKGVPEHLRNAALRKSWALDPAIRNYVNPALDYAYDWNTPGGVPGNSEIGAGMDVARLVSQIMGSGESAVESSVTEGHPGNEPAGDTEQSPDPGAAQESGPNLAAQAVRLGNETIATAQITPDVEEGTEVEAAAAEAPDAGGSVAPQQTVRRHGSAKPLV